MDDYACVGSGDGEGWRVIEDWRIKIGLSLILLLVAFFMMLLWVY